MNDQGNLIDEHDEMCKVPQDQFALLFGWEQYLEGVAAPLGVEVLGRTDDRCSAGGVSS